MRLNPVKSSQSEKTDDTTIKIAGELGGDARCWDEVYYQEAYTSLSVKNYDSETTAITLIVNSVDNVFKPR
jgi:hypothetical protein